MSMKVVEYVLLGRHGCQWLVHKLMAQLSGRQNSTNVDLVDLYFFLNLHICESKGLLKF